MKVILTANVANLGQVGEVKKVADGYARNYLIPNGLAIKATPGSEKEFERRQAAIAKREAAYTAEAQAMADKLSAVVLEFEAKAGETGRLYGSITPSDIAEALERETGFSFDRRKHVVSDPLREVGEHVVVIRLAADVSAEVKALVKPEGGELPEPLPAEAAPEEGDPASTEPVPAEEAPVEAASIEEGEPLEEE